MEVKIYNGGVSIKNMIVKLIIVVVIFLIFIVVCFFYPRYVKLELVNSIQNKDIVINEDCKDFNLEVHWCVIKSSPDSDYIFGFGEVAPDLRSQIVLANIEYFKDWGIDFDELGVDFERNNVVLAFSREITEMKFKRSDKFPYYTIPTVKTMMSKKFNANTIYVYKIPKYDIREEFKAYTETYVEK